MLSGFEDEGQKVHLVEFVKQVKDEFEHLNQGKDDLGFNIELKEEDYVMQAIKNVVPLLAN